MANGLELVGGQILRDGGFDDGPIALQGGHIAGDHLADTARLDVSGYMVLPGIIDMHGDAFERHVAPRPRALFPIEMGLAGADRDAAVNGITTAWLAQSWSWEAGMRHPDFAEEFLAAIEAYRARALIDLRVQLRCETHTVGSFRRLLAAVERFGVDYVVFNNHIPEALAILRDDPQDFAAWGARSGMSFEQHREIVLSAGAKEHLVPQFVTDLAEAFTRVGVRFGSHDDEDVETRARYADLGAAVCEFPTAQGPAQAAKSAGDHVIMGAPNVVRGGSQAGNISAESLVADGLCDVLVSDYHYPALPQAAFALADKGVLDLAKAWALISTNAARAMGLADRGSIAQGQRADLVFIETQTRVIEGTLSNGRWAHLSGGLADRMSAPRNVIVRAAE